MKNTHLFQFLSLLSLFLFSSIASYAQPELTDNASLYTIGIDATSPSDFRQGEYREFRVPTNPEFDYIRFTVRGADGGTATSGSASAQGGDGAIIEFSIKIGNGADELAPGQVLRFVIGKKGQDHSANVLAHANSGGGGGTGILIWEGGTWIPLAIAGGGGGAKRRPSNGENGQGGRAGEDGGDGIGDQSGTGGTNGGGGQDGRGGNGGGYYGGWTNSNFSSIDGGIGEEGTHCVGGTANGGGNGGWGCGGGGGAEDDDQANGPGGGGGYSGGGGGGCALNTCRGGGGGSLLDTNYAYDHTITAGGANSPSVSGYVRYQFFCSSRFATAPSITQDASCYNTESIQLAEEDYKFWCDEVTYRRVDNSEVNATGLFEGLLPGQSYDFEMLYAGEVVDTYTHTVDSDVDTEDPFVSCGDLVIDLNDDLNPTVTLEELASIITDNCGIASSTIVGQGDEVSFTCDDLGVNSFTIRATDHAGNSKSCIVNVEITGGYPDLNPTSPAMNDLTLYLDANGEATLGDGDLLFAAVLSTICFTQAQAQANYSVPTAYQNLDCDDVGTFSFFLDEADSNFPDAEQTITLIDPIPITASVANITVNLNASGVGTLSMDDLNFTVSDNCYSNAEIIANYSLPSEFSMFDCMDIGTFPVTLDGSDSDFPSVIFQVTVESSALSFPAVNADFCANNSFDLSSLEDDITTASGTFTYTQAIERLYIPNYNDNNVSVIDLTTNSVITSIAVGTNPWGVGVRPDGKKVYIANYTSDDVSVIDVASNTVDATISVGNLPLGLAFNSSGSRLYVTNIVGGSISVINTATNAVINTISVGNSPWGIALSPDDSKIYVAQEGDNTLGVFNAATGANIATIPVERNPRGIAISADGTKVYVGCESGFSPNLSKGAINIIDISTNVLLETLYTDYRKPTAFAVHPTGDLYTGHEAMGSGLISRTTPSNVTTYFPIEAGMLNNFRGISLNDDGSRLYLSDSEEDKVFIYNPLTNTEVTTIAVGDAPISRGYFYVKTTIDIASPSTYTPTAGAIINVAFDGGGECAATTTITFANEVNCVELAVKVLLQGPYNSSNDEMNANLSSLLPATVNSYTMLASATSNTGTEAIVDWVTIELRDASDNTSVLATRPALLQADGDVVDMDGSSAVTFADLDISSAYVVVRHRNHLGVMTATPVSFN